MRIAVPPPSVKSVQVVVPDQGDRCENDGGQREVGQRQSKQQVEIAVAVGVRRPGEYENLENVEYD